MKIGEWNNAARCAKCGHGNWAVGWVWSDLQVEAFQANHQRGVPNNVCPKCGGTGWHRDIGRVVSRRVWWNPFSWWRPLAWEWKSIPQAPQAPQPKPPTPDRRPGVVYPFRPKDVGEA
jgi:hypothetical protein